MYKTRRQYQKTLLSKSRRYRKQGGTISPEEQRRLAEQSAQIERAIIRAEQSARIAEEAARRAEQAAVRILEETRRRRAQQDHPNQDTP